MKHSNLTGMEEKSSIIQLKQKLTEYKMSPNRCHLGGCRHHPVPYVAEASAHCKLWLQQRNLVEDRFVVLHSRAKNLMMLKPVTCFAFPLRNRTEKSVCRSLSLVRRVHYKRAVFQKSFKFTLSFGKCIGIQSAVLSTLSMSAHKHECPLWLVDWSSAVSI